MTRLIKCATAIVIGASLTYLFVAKRKRAKAAAAVAVSNHRPVASNGAAAVLPVVVIPSELPPWWSVAPAVLYPPQYAVTPLILQQSHSACISQAFIAFDDFEQRTNAVSLPFPTQDGDDLTAFFSSYIQSACPFFRESKAQVATVSDVWITPEASVFTHIALSNEFIAFLYVSVETKTVVSLVFIGTFDIANLPLPQEPFVDVVVPLLSSIALLPSAASQILPAKRHNLDGKIRVQYRHPQGKGFALSLPAQRCRVACEEVSGPPVSTVITAYARQGLNAALLTISTDAVDALLSTAESKEQSVAALRSNLLSRCGSDESRGFLSDVDVSVFEDGDAGEAFGSLDSSSSLNSPLVGSKHCKATVTTSFMSASLGFGCKIPSNATPIHQVQFSAVPLVMLFPNGYDDDPVVSVSRLVQLPQGWEQALPAATDDEFVELIKHNIILHLTPWETRSEHPVITTADVSGQRAFVWMEAQDGRTCRTYACPVVSKCTSSKATKEEVHAAAVRIIQLVLIRWECDSERWTQLNPLLRELMDTVQIL